MIKRYLDLYNTVKPGSVLVLLGPRRSGKTTLLNTLPDTVDGSIISYRGDELRVQVVYKKATQGASGVGRDL